MKLSIGQKAPLFSLYDSDKQKVSLEDFKGRNVLLLFYPQAFTGVCTKELCGVRDNIALYNTVDAQVLGISVDSVFTLKKYKEEQELNFPLLSDFNKEVSDAYGSLYETWIFDMKGVSKRSAFVIDREGVVKYAEVLDNAGEVPDFQKINHELSELARTTQNNKQ
jgi:glutaredoxin-dependent peroxiredoxin